MKKSFLVFFVALIVSSFAFVFFQHHNNRSQQSLNNSVQQNIVRVETEMSQDKQDVVDDGSALIIPESDFSILNNRYVLTRERLFYLYEDTKLLDVENIQSSSDFESFIANPPERLNYTKQQFGQFYREVFGIDLKSLKVVSVDDYVADDYHVFYAGEPFTTATSTFYVLGPERIVSDGKFVYCKNKVISGANPSQFRRAAANDVQNLELVSVLPYAYVDNTTLYSLGNFINTGDCEPILKVDIASFKRVASNYFLDKDYVYKYISAVMTNELFVLPGADVSSFEVLENGWSRDKNTLFYDAEKIEDSDPASFFMYEYKPKNSSYVKDKNNVYFISVICCKGDGSGSVSMVNGADPATFAPLGNSEVLSYAKDGHSMYVEGEKFTMADIATFKLLSDIAPNLAIDKNHLYVGNQVDGLILVEGVDIETFEIDATKYNNVDAYYGYTVRAADKNWNYLITPDLEGTTVLRVVE